MHDAARTLIDRFTRRDAVIGVVGLGYVGLPLVRAMHDAGFRVIGYDVDEAKIEHLRNGVAYLKHLGDTLAKELAASDRFTPTDNPEDLGACDAVCLCVPTPLGSHQDPDLSFVEDSTRMVGRVLKGGALVVLESTSYPGTTREVCLPLLGAGGRRCGEDFFLAFSPEREDPGRQGFETRTIPRLVGGVDEVSGKVAHALYAAAVEQAVLLDSAETAEAAKLLENIYRAVNIALVNELKPVLADMGIDIWRVIEAAATKPFGFHAFYPGPGLGGHCIPIDPYYLTHKAREYGHATRFIELAGEINSRMPLAVVETVAHALNQDAKPLKGSKVLVVGIAYKPDVDDVRETPAAEIIRMLLDKGAHVTYHDPLIERFPDMRKYQFDLATVPLDLACVDAADCVLIVTNHSGLDYPLLAARARLIVDTRNAMAKVPPGRARVIKA